MVEFYSGILAVIVKFGSTPGTDTHLAVLILKTYVSKEALSLKVTTLGRMEP